MHRVNSPHFWDNLANPGAAHDACWVWGGTRDHAGYGRFSFDGLRQPAHRVAYERIRGPVPAGLELDHLCRNKSCINPAHLEPVTRLENLRRAPGWKGNRTDPDTARRVTVNLPESLYRDLETRAGAKGISAYLRELVLADIGSIGPVPPGRNHDRQGDKDGD